MNVSSASPPPKRSVVIFARSAEKRVRPCGRKIDVPRGGKMDWSVVREKIAKHGMRNSNDLAIAPRPTSFLITDHRSLGTFSISAYYLRTMQASGIEKSNLNVQKE